MTDGGLVHVALFGSYRARLRATRGRTEVRIERPSSAADVLGTLGLSIEPGSLIVVNGEAVGPEKLLRAGDRLELFSPMGGGA